MLGVCPAAIGSLKALLGLLGVTRSQVLDLFADRSSSGQADEDFSCLTPVGILVGYPPPGLLAALPAGERGRCRACSAHWQGSSAASSTRACTAPVPRAGDRAVGVKRHDPGGVADHPRPAVRLPGLERLLHDDPGNRPLADRGREHPPTTLRPMTTPQPSPASRAWVQSRAVVPFWASNPSPPAISAWRGDPCPHLSGLSPGRGSWKHVGHSGVEKSRRRELRSARSR